MTEAIPEAINPMKNGYFNFKLTPNMAGSVIPSMADRDDDVAKPLVFSFLVMKYTAKVAAP